MENTYLCPRCLMRNRHEGKPNPITDIAFSLPAEFFKQIHEAIAQMEDKIERKNDTAELLSKRLSNEERFKCITRDDVEKWMSFDIKRDLMCAGTLVLDTNWLTEKLRWLEIDGYDLANVGNVTLFEVKCSFYYTRSTDGTLIPKGIRDKYENIVSDECRCGRCGRLLPPDTGKAKEIRILLQGNSRAGKSSCIVSAADWLLNMRGRGIEIKLCPLDPYRNDSHYHNWIQRELANYRAGYTVEKTPTTQDEPGLFSVLVTVNGEQRVLTFIDMPGEFFETAANGQDGLLRQYMPIYRCCDVVWTCMQYEVMAQMQKLSAEEISRMENRTRLTKDQLVRALDNYIARLNEIMNYLGANQVKKFPYHAVILTKSDAVGDYQDRLEESKIFATHPNNLADALIRYREKPDSAEVLALREFAFHHFASDVHRFFVASQKNPAANMCQIMDQFSPNTLYFAMSAYGHPAAKKDSNQPNEEHPSPPAPYHTQLPLLWSMAVCDQLPVCYDVELHKRNGALKKLFTARDDVSTGKVESECRMFSGADTNTHTNLLKNSYAYQKHIRFL